jgi:hypothetical protein
MNPVRRLAAGLAGALLAVAAVAPTALARPFPPRPSGWDKHPPLPPRGAAIRIVVVGGMPGWQIALIAVGAALLAATAAVLADRHGPPAARRSRWPPEPGPQESGVVPSASPARAAPPQPGWNHNDRR